VEIIDPSNPGLVAAIECNSNVTVSSASDASDIRENCQVIEGDLNIVAHDSETINLDGLEEIRGSLVIRDSSDQTSPLFNISSSTLKSIGGRLDAFLFPTVEKIILPNLANVTGSVSFEKMDHLTHIDLTSLQYLGSFTLSVETLEEFKLDGFQGFTGANGNGYVSISSAGNVTSLDGLFKNPVDVSNLDTLPEVYVSDIPKVTQLTFGWKQVGHLEICSQGCTIWEELSTLTLTLGGPSSESVEIGHLELRNGPAQLERGSQTKNLTVTFLESMNDHIKDMKLQFDHASEIKVRGDRLESLEFPVEAEQWNNVSISIWLVNNLDLMSAFNSEGTQTWFWPQNNMSSFYLMGYVSTDFL
jgi:hypothetical protein